MKMSRNLHFKSLLPCQLFKVTEYHQPKLYKQNKQVFWGFMGGVMWSEMKVSSQSLLSCLWKATEEKVKEKEGKEGGGWRREGGCD